jgi:two-component system response regulator ChvI
MPEIERHGELALHPSTARAFWRQRDVGLTITEYKIVTLLVSGGLHTYRTIYDAAYYVGFVAGSGKRGYSTNVRSLVKRIRRKFVAVDPGFSEIENVHKIGYRWLNSELR